MHKLWITALAGFAAVIVGAAGQSAAETDITYMTPLWNPDLQKWFQNEAVPAFEKLNPDIKVTIEYVNWGQLNSKIAVSTAGGVPPDVFITSGAGSAKEWGERGLALPLDRYVQNWPELKDFVAPALGVQKSAGHLYAIPTTLNLRTYVANVSLVSQAGLDAKASLGDWSHFVDEVKKLSNLFADKNMAGFRTNLGQYFEVVMDQAGAGFFDPDGHLALQTPAARASIQHVKDLYDAGGPDSRIFAGGAPADFKGGKAPLAWLELQSITAAEPALGKDGIALPEPVLDQAVLPITGMAISAASKHPDAAWKWVAFLSEPENLSRFNQLYGRVPPTLSGARSPQVASNPVLTRAIEIAVKYGSTTVGANRYGTLADVRGQLNTQLLNMFAGKQSPDAAIKQIEAAWNAQIAALAPTQAPGTP